MTAMPAVGQLAQDAVDLRLGPHVDAAGGLQQDQGLAVGEQRAADQHLLLVAAAQEDDPLPGPGQLDVQGLLRMRWKLRHLLARRG